MREGWEIKRLGDVVFPIESVDPTKTPDRTFRYVDVSSVSNETFEIVEPAEIVGRKAPSRARRKIKSGDVIFATIRPTLRRIAIVPPRLDGEVCSTGYFVFRAKPFLNHKFLFYHLFTDRFLGAMGRLQTGASYPAVNDAQVRLQEIAYPSLTEQQRIVGMLDEAFDGLETAADNTEKNLGNARELFDSYLNSLFMNADEGWTRKTLGEVCGISSHLVDPRDPKFFDLLHVGGANMVSKTGELIGIRTAREEGLISGKFLFDSSMVLYSKIRPYLMKACRPDFDGLCSADVYPLAPNVEQLDRNFLFHVLMSKDFTAFAVAGSARAGMPKVNRERLFKYPMKLPKIEEQIKLARRLDTISAEVARIEGVYQQKSSALAELRRSLLQKAFSGELTLPPSFANNEAAE